jgi:hypothetical protein
MAENDTFSRAEKLLVTLAWLKVSAIPSFLLLAHDVPLKSSSGADSSVAILPLLWGLTAGLTSPVYVRALGHVEDAGAQPPAERNLHHLPPACVGLVEEAAAIRADLSDLDEALTRAWLLTQALERTPADVRMFVESTGATLQDVHELLRLRTTTLSRRKEAQLRERLEAVLRSFEDALAQPPTSGFR